MSQWEIAVSVATLVVTYTASIVGMILWLSNKFRQLERLIFKEIGWLRKDAMEARRMYEKRLEGIGLRLQRVELRVFGFTKSPADEPPYTHDIQSDDQEQ